MRKQLVFSVMLSLGVLGGLTVCPVEANASVQQDQTIKVSGQVVDQDGEALIGATVKVKNAQAGVITDYDGNFSIDAPANGTLVVSYVGYKDREIAVRGRAIIEQIQMESDAMMLEQVVVVGYGVQKKADLTGSVSIVNADELKRVSHSNISSMLEGKVAGVSITSDGQPGADPTVRIRGIGTLNGNQAPLYVIDGVPMGTSIRDFSPNDIETIQVLKDASAGAIYGSRAANGVVIITTKGGKKDQPLKVDYKGYFGVDQIQKGVYDVMNAAQYSNYLGQAAYNSVTPLPGGYSKGEDGVYRFFDNTDTDWLGEVFKTGIRQNHSVNLSGGGAHNTYNISLDYFKQKGTLEGAGPNFERYTARVNNTMDTKFIKFRTSFVYSHSDQDGMARANTDASYVQGLYGANDPVIYNALLIQPTIKAYDESTWVLDDVVGAASAYNHDAMGYGVYYDTIHGDISARNPLFYNNMLTRNTIVDRFVGTASADVDLLKMIGVESKNHSLSYKLNLSYSTTNVKGRMWNPAWIQSNRVYQAKENETLVDNHNKYTDALIENTLTYDGTMGLHHVNLVVGQTFQQENSSFLTVTGTEFTEPYYLQFQNAATRDASSSEYKHTIASYLARLNYDYDGKYLISGIIRRDGSSRLSPDSRWDTFKSISLGWRFDKEKFFPIDRNIINMFKLRASYGELGNEASVADYATQTVMDRKNMSYSFANSAVYGSAVHNYTYTSLSWEKRKTYNIGLDLAFFNNRIEFTAEWYKNKSEDLLYSVPVPASAGVANTTVTMNAASLENSGFEFSVTYRNHDHALKHEISANLSTLKNKVTSLGFGEERYITGAYITQVGEEAGKFYGWDYQLAELNAMAQSKGFSEYQPGANVGDCYYRDINGDGQINSDDQTVLGSGLPSVNFGLSAHLEYGIFDLSISTYGALGYHVTDDLYNALNSCYGYGNKDVSILGANVGSEYDQNGNVIKYVADVIANVELGCNLPNKWFADYVSGVRIYVSAQNLYTFTKYHGYNVDFAGGTFTPGYNYCSYPTPRSFMAGINFTF